MKWKKRYESWTNESWPHEGDSRVVTYFAWFPVSAIRGEKRWLETVRINQRYSTILGWYNNYFMTV